MGIDAKHETILEELSVLGRKPYLSDFFQKYLADFAKSNLRIYVPQAWGVSSKTVVGRTNAPSERETVSYTHLRAHET